VTLSDDLSVRAAAQERRLNVPWLSLDATARQASPVWVPVALAAAVALGFATWSLAAGDFGWRDAVGVVALLAAAAIAEAYPVPIEGVAVGATSVATIFLVAVAVVYGWAAASVAAFFAMAVVEVARRRPFSRIVFNCGIYVLAAAAVGAVAGAFDDDSLLQLVLASIAAAGAFYVVDITLLSAVLARLSRGRFASSLRGYVYATLTPFAILASLAVILVVLWEQSPFVAIVLVVPVLATALYQRWLHGALDRLREFDRLKDEFIAIVSHELRTPLTSVYGAALTLRTHELDAPRRRQLLDIVATESARLGRLLDDILWVSRLDAGRDETVITRVEPFELVTDVIAAARTHAGPGTSLELDYDASSLAVAADSDKLRQVLVNLVENAIKYSGGHIEVRVEPHCATTRFSVSDDGPGIPPEQGDRIFEKFYRLDASTTRAVGGTGLGLYICRELVEAMRGRIWVTSTPGEGSTFSFELPVDQSR
jgi:signal transduction histidine kinase